MHTPTPWKILAGTDNVLIGIPERSTAYVADDRVQVFVPAVENAEFILRAVNAYEAHIKALDMLVAQMERFVDAPAMDQCQQHCDTDTLKAYNFACSLLATAGALPDAR